MVRLNDVNTTDITGAIRLGCETMSRCFDSDDDDMPFFGAKLRPVAEMGFSRAHSESHVPGRHLNAILNAEDVLGVTVGEEAVEKHTRAAFFSYSGSIPLPLNRESVGGPLVCFLPHNVREGFHALYALVRYRDSSRAREIAEASIDAISNLWDPDNGWDESTLTRTYGLTYLPEKTFISGIGRAIGPLVKYYRATGYGPSLELAVLLKERALKEAFVGDGTFDPSRFGDHNHSTTCTMSSLAQLADLTQDQTLMERVRTFYDNGLWDIRDEVGYNIENSRSDGNNTGRGEVNNSGDILETALILGRWGHTRFYQDAERILRGHVLPSQLRDVSWVDEDSCQSLSDGRRDVAQRLRGAWGFPAPYGHEPIGLKDSIDYRVGFNLDIVGGTVGSLCEAHREVTRFNEFGHWVNLLFDHETNHIKTESPYDSSSLTVTLKTPGPLFVRIPSWVDDFEMNICGEYQLTNGYLFITSPPVNRPISVSFPLTVQDLVLKNVAGPIRARFRGDSVVAMDDLGADLTFFEPFAIGHATIPENAPEDPMH